MENLNVNKIIDLQRYYCDLKERIERELSPIKKYKLKKLLIRIILILKKYNAYPVDCSKFKKVINYNLYPSVKQNISDNDTEPSILYPEQPYDVSHMHFTPEEDISDDFSEPVGQPPPLLPILNSQDVRIPEDRPEEFEPPLTPPPAPKPRTRQPKAIPKPRRPISSNVKPITEPKPKAQGRGRGRGLGRGRGKTPVITQEEADRQNKAFSQRLHKTIEQEKERDKPKTEGIMGDPQFVERFKQEFAPVFGHDDEPLIQETEALREYERQTASEEERQRIEKQQKEERELQEFRRRKSEEDERRKLEEHKQRVDEQRKEVERKTEMELQRQYEANQRQIEEIERREALQRQEQERLRQRQERQEQEDTTEPQSRRISEALLQHVNSLRAETENVLLNIPRHTLAEGDRRLREISENLKPVLHKSFRLTQEWSKIIGSLSNRVMRSLAINSINALNQGIDRIYLMLERTESENPELPSEFIEIDDLSQFSDSDDEDFKTHALETLQNIGNKIKSVTEMAGLAAISMTLLPIIQGVELAHGAGGQLLRLGTQGVDALRDILSRHVTIENLENKVDQFLTENDFILQQRARASELSEADSISADVLRIQREHEQLMRTIERHNEELDRDLEKLEEERHRHARASASIQDILTEYDEEIEARIERQSLREGKKYAERLRQLRERDREMREEQLERQFPSSIPPLIPRQIFRRTQPRTQPREPSSSSSEKSFYSVGSNVSTRASARIAKLRERAEYIDQQIETREQQKDKLDELLGRLQSLGL